MVYAAGRYYSHPMTQQPDTDNRPLDAPAHARPGDDASMRSLSEELRALVEVADGGPMSVAQILDHLQDRGSNLFIVVITTPFLLLPTTFGLSAPMGVAVAILGFCQAIGRRPWLPQWLLKKEFPFESLRKTMERAAKFSSWVEKVSKPRLAFMLWPGVASLAGIGLIIWGLLMGLPGPNNVFAAMILLYAFGLLMRDGLLLIVAHVLTFSAPVLAIIYWDKIVEVFTGMWDKVSGFF